MNHRPSCLAGSTASLGRTRFDLNVVSFLNFMNFIYLFIHCKKIHQVHKCLKIPKPKNTNPIITLIYNKTTHRPDFNECRVFKNIDGEGV